MEFLVEKVGMSRTIQVPSFPVTLLKVVEAKVCELQEDGRAVVAYRKGKSNNKSVEGQQKKYSLTKEFNRFATLKVTNQEPGDLDLSGLGEAKTLKLTFSTKGRGYTGPIKRWNFAMGPNSHGSRFHRRTGSIGNCEWPGRVMKGKKMAGQYGNEKVTVKGEVISFDQENGILVMKGSVPGHNGAYGRVKVVK